MILSPQIAPESMGDYVREQWARLFGAGRGAFLDLGAYDLGPSSISRPFLAAGWSALLAEGDSYNFARLLSGVHSAGFARRVDCLAAAVLPIAGISPWYTVAGTADLSTASKDWTHKPWTASAHYLPAYVAAVTPADILARFGFDWDCVSIDLEGVTAEVFNAIPWPKMARTRMVVAEAHPDILLPTLAPLGFEPLRADCVNSVLIRTTMP